MSSFMISEKLFLFSLQIFGFTMSKDYKMYAFLQI